MDVGVYPYPHGDPLLIDKIVNEFLSQGKFDKLRKECMSDADTKPAYQNLVQRVENTVTQFLKKQVWKPDLNKNQLRDSLRKHILESKFFDAGINRIVDQVVNPNVLATVFLPEVEEVVYNYLSIPRPSDKNQRKGPSDERTKSSGKDYEYKTSQDHEKFEKHGRDDYRKDNHVGNEGKDFDKKPDFFNESIKTEPQDEKEKVKLEPEEVSLTPVEKMEISSDESQESVSKIPVEGLNINEVEGPSVPDSDDSAPLEINEKSMSESRDSEDSIMNQMSPISQGRLTPDLEEEEKPEEKPVEVEKPVEEDKPVEEKKPLSFIGRIPKIKREEPTNPKEKLETKNVYSSDDSEYSDEKRKKNEKSERKREESDRTKEKKREERRERSRDRHKDHKRERSRDRHKKSSSSSSSSQRERSSSHHKSSHRHKDSKSKRKEDEKKKSKSTDDHCRERNKKEDRRSTDRDSNERERGRSSGGRTEGESKKREKEQPKEEAREGSNQKEEVEKEGEPQGEVEEVEKPETNTVLDFNELFRSGAITRLEFPKLTDDFYVKFNSTGFRYFEEWEKSKLDCEEEFKEFVDEAENNLSLLSDDESDFEFDKKLEEENRTTIDNLLRGLGNFRRSVMFDPDTSQFYKWRNNKFYQKFRKKEEKPEKHESDESIKENIDRGEKNRALHLKLINKYRKKAMRMGKPRRRHRRPESGGIKEKNENQTEKPETFLGTNVVENVNEAVPEIVGLRKNEAVTLPESPDENQDWTTHVQKKDGNPETKLGQNLPLNLPPSPDSDDVNTNNGINAKVPRKRIIKEEENAVRKKQSKRNHSQKYDSQDLYKPRPILNGSRTRGRERGLERDLVSLDSSDSR